TQLINKCYKQAGIKGDPYNLLSAYHPKKLMDSLTDIALDAFEKPEWSEKDGWTVWRVHQNAPILLQSLANHTSALANHVHKIGLMKLDEEGIRKLARDTANDRRSNFWQRHNLIKASAKARGATAEELAEMLPEMPPLRDLCPEHQRRCIRSERHRVDGHV